MTKIGLMGLRYGVLIEGRRDVWFAGECGNCRVQMRKLKPRADLYHDYGFFILPWDARSPIAPILTACNIAVPNSLDGGFILIGYVDQDAQAKLYRGHIHHWPIEIRKLPDTRKKDYSHGVFIDESEHDATELRTAMGCIGMTYPSSTKPQQEQAA